MTRFSIGVPIVLVAFSVLLVGCPPQPGIDVSPATLAIEPGADATLTVKNTSAKNVTLDIAVTADPAWLTVDGAATATLSLDGKAEAALTVAVAAAKAEFATGTITVAATKADGTEVETVEVSVTTGTPYYYTQNFDADLEDKIVLFSEVNAPSYYVAEIGELAADAGPAVRNVSLEDVDPLLFVDSAPYPYTLDVGETLSLYGVDYYGIYVGIDGRVSLGAATGATDGVDLFADHFAVAGVSALLAPLTPDDVYLVPLEDRIVIVYEGANSFQIELFFAAEEAKADTPSIAIAWFEVEAGLDAVVGLSEGPGAAPDDFVATATDLTAAAPATNTAPAKVALSF